MKKKLGLNKESLRRLTRRELDRVAGGESNSCPYPRQACSGGCGPTVDGCPE